MKARAILVSILSVLALSGCGEDPQAPPQQPVEAPPTLATLLTTLEAAETARKEGRGEEALAQFDEILSLLQILSHNTFTRLVPTKHGPVPTYPDGFSDEPEIELFDLENRLWPGDEECVAVIRFLFDADRPRMAHWLHHRCMNRFAIKDRAGLYELLNHENAKIEGMPGDVMMKQIRDRLQWGDWDDVPPGIQDHMQQMESDPNR